MATVELASFHFNPFQTKGGAGGEQNPLPSGLVTLSYVKTICPPEPPEPSPPPYHLIPKHTQLSHHFCEIRCLMSNCRGYTLVEADSELSVYSPLMQLDGFWLYISLLASSSTLKMGRNIVPKHYTQTTRRDIPEDSSAF
jgi:hypothetical protein